MRICIIIPALNEAAQIESVLACLQDARAAGHQIILVDGGSTDDTVSRADPWVDAVIQSPQGRAAQMNAGAAHCAGDVMWFLHADTKPEAQSVSCLVAATERAKDGIYWGRFDVRLDDSSWSFRLIEFMMNWRSRITSVATGDQGIFVSTALHHQLGGFAMIPLMEDIEYCKRLRRVCKPINLSARLLTSTRRWRKSGVARTVLLMWVIRLGYVCGVPPERLASWYRK